MKPALFFVGCIAAIPAVVSVATAATLWWYENRWLPRICGED